MVKEGSDVILPCSIGVDLESKLFDWKKDGEKEVFLYDAGDSYSSGRAGQDVLFRGRVSHFKDELKHGNASILIHNTKVADSGDYTCAFPRLQSQIFHIQLLVGELSSLITPGWKGVHSFKLRKSYYYKHVDTLLD